MPEAHHISFFLLEPPVSDLAAGDDGILATGALSALSPLSEPELEPVSFLITTPVSPSGSFGSMHLQPRPSQFMIIGGLQLLGAGCACATPDVPQSMAANASTFRTRMTALPRKKYIGCKSKGITHHANHH
jgi:hypothetical protein